MQRVLLILAVLAALAALASGYVSPPRKQLPITVDERAYISAWATEFLTALSEKWDTNELRKRAHPMLLRNIESGGHVLAQDFAPLVPMGTLRNDNCALTNFATSREPPDRFAIADFNCHAEYEHGRAEILMEIKQDHIRSPWRLTQFNFTIVSPVDGQ